MFLVMMAQHIAAVQSVLYNMYYNFLFKVLQDPWFKLDNKLTDMDVQVQEEKSNLFSNSSTNRLRGRVHLHKYISDFLLVLLVLPHYQTQSSNFLYIFSFVRYAVSFYTQKEYILVMDYGLCMMMDILKNFYAL